MTIPSKTEDDEVRLFALTGAIAEQLQHFSDRVAHFDDARQREAAYDKLIAETCWVAAGFEKRNAPQVALSDVIATVSELQLARAEASRLAAAHAIGASMTASEMSQLRSQAMRFTATQSMALRMLTLFIGQR